jgi:diguanylate cyclase (GGDEF)-like protein
VTGESALNETFLRKPISQLVNREEFLHLLKNGLQDANSKRAPLALFFIDIDRFQAINTTLGHDAASQILEEVALRISNTMREAVAVAHLGSDDFSFFLSDYRSADQLRNIAHRVLQTIREAIQVDGNEMLVTASAGISIYPDKAANAEELIHQASFAVRKARNLGGDTCRVFTRRTQIDSLKKLNLEIELRKAVNNNDLEVFYQPKMDLATDRINALEALVRWHHPEFGWVSPDAFIPIAEETGLISPIGEWVLETAALDGCRWHKAGIPIEKIAVNLSGQQIARHDMAASVKRIFNRIDAPPQLLVLELTESMLIEALDSTLDLLHRLRVMGVEIAIDDFGTGYSSFRMLKSFPVDILKIDQMFIQDLANNDVDMTITRAIIEIAHSMDIKVIAEGVENESHVALLQELGCDSVQGFYISRALPKKEINRLLFDHYRARQLSFW